MPGGKIPGTFGNGFEDAPAVPFGYPENGLTGISPTTAGVPGKIPGTYGEGANNDNVAPRVPFDGPPLASQDPANTDFGEGTWKGEWGGRRKGGV